MPEIREISAETKKALQGLAPFSTTSTIEFTPKGYEIKVKDSEGKDTEEYMIPEEVWPLFKMRPWTKLEASRIRKSMPKYANSKDDTEIREYVRKVIVGWDNLVDAGTGDVMDYEEEETGGASKEIFDCFPSSLITDLLNKALTISGIVDMERVGLRS